MTDPIPPHASGSSETPGDPAPHGDASEPTGSYTPPPGETPPGLPPNLIGTPLTSPHTPPAGEAGTVHETLSGIGRYAVFGEIGRGGMGSVLRGRDDALGRDLAIKILRAEHHDRPDLVRRFVDEARIGGQLQHPGVVPVYELGEAAAPNAPGPRPYFTMKLIEGRTLADLLAQRGTPADELPHFLKVFEQICQTLAYAHARHIIHRDLKPANIMVGAFGEVQIMDWGLAKALGDEGGGARDEAHALGAPPLAPPPSSLDETRVGTILGTPAYMPPEQARGERLDERGDVFGLGAILCEILTGRPPYSKSGSRGVLEQARQGDVAEALARLDGCGADADLVQLAHECLAPQLADRPRHAGVVAERMTAYLTAVQERLRAAERERAAAEARAEEARAKAAAEQRARRLILTLAAVVLLSVLGGAAGGLRFQYDRAQRAAEQLAREADDARKEAAAVQAVSLTLEQAQDQMNRRQLSAALAMARRAEGLLAGGGATLRPRVEEMLADLQMLARLEQVRLETVEMRADQTGFDPAYLMPRYREAFDRYGISVLTLGIEEAAAQIRRRVIRAQLLTAIDHWANFTPDAASRRRLFAVAQAADADARGMSAEMRQAMIDGDAKAVRRLLFTDDRVKQLPPPMLVNFAAWLSTHGDAARSVQLLQSSLARHPDDFWLHYQLGYSLMHLQPPNVVDAVRHDTAAAALRPEVASVWINLGGALAAQGRHTDSMDAFNKALALAPDFAPTHYNVGVAQMRGGDAARARASFEEAIRLQPAFAPAHYALGGLLARQRALDDAEKHLREAIRLQPDYAAAHGDLGTLLTIRGRVDDAIESYRTALKYAPADAKVWQHLGEAQGRHGKWDDAASSFETALGIDPQRAEALNDLGYVRLQQKRLDDAVAALRKAVALQPNDLKANGNLATALRLHGRLKEAVGAYRKISELQPSADAHYSLGNALLEASDLPAAQAACEQALKLDPDHAPARGTLGLVLMNSGQFAEAKKHIAKGRDLLDRNDPRRRQLDAVLAQCEQLTRVTSKLPAILKGDAKPADNAERILLASFCMQVKHQYAAAARLLADGFAADRKLLEDLPGGLRFRAACAAVAAAAGRGDDAATLDDASRLHWRKQARAWLRDDLAAWRKQADKGPLARTQACAAVQRWQTEPLLAAVREADHRVWLPADERQTWEQLWHEAAEFCKQPVP